MPSRLRPLLAFVVLLGALPCRGAVHPRLFLTPDELIALKTRAADTQTNALGYVPHDVWQTILAQADRFADGPPYHHEVVMPGAEGGPGKLWQYTLSKSPPPRHDDYPHYPPWTGMFQEGSDSITTRIEYLALAHKMTGKPKYFAAAKDVVFAMIAWPGIWTDPSYGGGKPCLDTGHAAAWVSVFYDWCHDDLTAAQRRLVHRALADKALVPIDQLLDGISAYHNGAAIITNGLCLGGIALSGEDPRAALWIKRAVAKARANFDAQGRDGGAMEGPGYGTYAVDCFAEMFWALRTAGIANPLLEHVYIKTLPRYCITLLNPNNFQQPCFGDGGPTAGFGRMMLTLALAGDRDAAWYCRQIGQTVPRTAKDFILLDPQRIHPEEPKLNPSGCFVDVGYAVLRDGYRPGSAFLALKCGPPEAVVGHNHFDHNSFVINYAGTWVAWDPGYRSYFDPPQRRYSTSTLGHNSVVLDLDDEYLAAKTDSVPGHDQVQLNRGRIREFFSSSAYDYVRGAAAESYNSPQLHVLDRFDRQIVFAKPHVFFIRDTLAAPAEHTYSFLLHVGPSGRFVLHDDGATAVTSPGLFQFHAYSPGGLRLKAAEYPGAQQRGPYLAASTSRRREAVITSVLVPRQRPELIDNGGFENGFAGWIPRDKEHHVLDTAVKHGGAASARIDQAGYYYTQHFTVPPGSRVTARWWARASQKGAGSTFFYWKGGTAFAHKAGPAADGQQWRLYEMSDVVPEAAQEVCLALQYSGAGQCWYDDVEINCDPPLPSSTLAEVTPLGDGSEGAVARVDAATYILACGQAGQLRQFAAAGHHIESDAELAVVTLKAGGATAWALRGTRITLDGAPVTPEGGSWQVKFDSQQE